MRSFRHWSPLYIWDRLKLMHYQRRNLESPWLTQAMISILESWVRPEDVGLEWGSGRSTVWFAKRVAEITSVEHDPKWASIVRKRLYVANLETRVSYRFCPDGANEQPTSEYVMVVEQFEDRSLDFCLVDGVARDHCALFCIPRIRPGGILIIDNANWYIPRDPKSRAPNSRVVHDGFASQHWADFANRVKNWRCIWTTNGITDTAFWVCPGRRYTK